MKSLIILILTLSLFSIQNIQAQKKSKEERQAELDKRKNEKSYDNTLDYQNLPKDYCKIDHNCKTKFKYDEFDQYYLYKLVPSQVTNIAENTGLTTYYTYSLRKIKKDGRTIISMTFELPYIEQCRTEKSYVQLLFENKDVIKLPTLFKSVDCGIGYLTVEITDVIDDLLNRNIDKVRVSIEYNEDFIFTRNDNQIERFKNNLRCITDVDYK